MSTCIVPGYGTDTHPRRLAGLYLGNPAYGVSDGSNIIPQAALQPYIDEALNELEFLLGDPVSPK